MKAVSKIESDFDPKQRTGSYSGLFQLSKGEFAEYGSGDILDARDNAVAAATNPRPCGRSHKATPEWSLPATGLSDANLIATVQFCMIGLVVTLIVILSFPDLGALIEQYNRY